MTRFPQGPPDAGVSPFAAEFAEAMRADGFALDFSMESLERVVDEILDSPDVNLDQSPQSWRTQAGLEAYVGETLARLHDGIWKGQFSQENPGVNFYTSYVEFGQYRYYPSHFLGYRISNGPGEGTFAEHLKRKLPEIVGRRPNET